MKKVKVFNKYFTRKIPSFVEKYRLRRDAFVKYKIVELKDMSSAAKRISAKVVVDINRDHEDEIKKLVQELVEVVRNQKVESPKTLIRHGDKPFEVVYLYLYKNIDEANHGLPLARASFIDPNCKKKPLHFSDEYIDENTTIKFERMYEEVSNLVHEYKVSDEVFFKNVKQQFGKLLEIYELTERNLGDFDLLAEKYKDYDSIFRDMEHEGFVGYPNDKYMGIYNNHQSLLASLHNIGLITNNKNYNAIQKHHLVELNLETARKNVEYLLEKLK